jgi:ATP-dependent DNA helicase PIF1
MSGRGRYQTREEFDPIMAVSSMTASTARRPNESLNHYAVRSPAALIHLMHQTRKRLERSMGGEESESDEEQQEQQDQDRPPVRMARSIGEMLQVAKMSRTHKAAAAVPGLPGLPVAPQPPQPPQPSAPLPDFEIHALSSWEEWRPFHTARAPEQARRITFDASQLERFSDGQRQAAHLIEVGLSVFVTGPGGTGKSELIHAIRQAAEGSGLNIVVTASTGIAARNIGGITLHRFAGMGLIDAAKMGSGACLARARRFDDEDYRIRNWQEVDLLIVDEISMLSMFMLQELDAVARHARLRNGKGIVSKPFGGIQLVFLGDFAQLIPESGGAAGAARAGGGSAGGAAGAAKEWIMPLLGPWCEMVPYTVLLQTIFRQKDDSFRAMLNRIRLGVVNQGDLYRLNASVGGETLASGETGPELCAFRKMVQQANDKAMESLEAERVVFVARAINWPDTVDGRKEFEAVCQEVGAELPVTLCAGARVLLTKNIDPDRGLVNGALGKVVAFEQGMPTIAWDHHSPETPPMALHPIVLDSTGRIVPDSEREEEAGAGAAVVAVVAAAAAAAHPVSGKPKTAGDVGGSSSKSKKLISFLPLLCAWSMTVHRAQGMTLDRVRVNGRSMRMPALLYTALSRVRSMAGLQIAGGKVSAENIVAHPQVIAYYRAIEESIGSSSESESSSPALAVMPSVILAAKARGV